jgi:hypothetical protein
MVAMSLVAHCALSVVSTDTGSGVASSTLVRTTATLSNDVCGSFGSPVTIVGSPSQSGLADGCYKYTLTGTDNVGNSASVATTVKVDSVAPSTTDNTASIGNAWHNTNTTVTLTPTDGGSGVASTYYTTNGSTPTTSSSEGTSVSLTTTGVYTIKYFSVDNAGNAEAVQTAGTQIRIDKTLPTNALSMTGATNAFLNGTTPYFKNNAAGSFQLVNTVTDAHSGPNSATFPNVTSSNWTHPAQTVTTPSGGALHLEHLLVDERRRNTLRQPGDVHVYRCRRQHQRQHLPHLHERHHRADGAGRDLPRRRRPVQHDDSGRRLHQRDLRYRQRCGEWCRQGRGQRAAGRGDYWNGSSFASAVQVFNLASGTTSWSYGMAGASFPTNGSYTVSVRTTDNVGNVSSVTTTTFTIDRTAPTATNITMNNNGTLGRANEDDTLVVTYGETMDASTFCSTWVNDGSTKTLSGGNVVVTITDHGTDDTFSVSTTSGCTLRFGSVALNANYVTSTVNFSGNGSNASSVSWNPTTNQLTITLGNGNGQSTGVVASVPSYTPDSALKDLAGNTVSAGPFAGTSSRF